MPENGELKHEFENDVKTYSIQTENVESRLSGWFENDVKVYNIQSLMKWLEYGNSLRIM